MNRNFTFSTALKSLKTAGLSASILLTVIANQASAQLSPGAPAKFGVDGDSKNDSKISGTFDATGTHDWFKLNTGNGIGVIDTINTSAYKTSLAAGNNIAFSKGMAVPRYSTVDNSILLDARYIRDYFGIGSGSNSDLTTFASGAKNGDLPTAWSTKPGGASISNKADIIDAYAHFRRDGIVVSGPTPSHLIAYVGVTTAAAVGDRFFDAELYCSKIAYNSATGKFSNSGSALTGGHTSWIFNTDGSVKSFGDMSIGFDYTSSAVKNIYVMIWVSYLDFSTANPTKFSFVAGSFTGSTSTGAYGYAKIQPKTGTAATWGSANSALTLATPWGTTSQTLGSGTNNYYNANYDIAQFGEAAIDLTALGIDPVLVAGSNYCTPPFSTIIFKSRSSSSFTSSLQDFTGPYEFFQGTAPSSAISSVLNLTCLNTSTVLSAQTYVEGSYYSWTTTDGAISGSSEGASVIVTKPGTYSLESTAYKGCASTKESAVVYQDIFKPKATAYVSNILTNTAITATLKGGDTTASQYSNANGSYKGLTWSWTGPESFVSDVQNPTTTKEGVYMLVVTEVSNGCKDTAVTNVLNQQALVLAANDIVFTAAKQSKNNIKINWSVNEESIKSFELYRSADGSNFNKIATIAADASASVQKNTLIDDVSDLHTTKVLYKLKWINKNGHVEYSSIKSVSLLDQASLGLAVWPNPAVTSTTLTFTSGNKATASVQFIDFSGKVAMQKSVQVQEGVNKITLSSIASLQNGVYTVRVINGTQVLTNRMLKTN